MSCCTKVGGSGSGKKKEWVQLDLRRKKAAAEYQWLGISITKKHSVPLDFICFHRTHRDFTLILLLAPFILTTSSKETEDSLNTSINIAGHGTLEVWFGQKKGMGPT